MQNSIYYLNIPNRQTFLYEISIVIFVRTPKISLHNFDNIL